jgi:hypothetical protein
MTGVPSKPDFSELVLNSQSTSGRSVILPVATPVDVEFPRPTGQSVTNGNSCGLFVGWTVEPVADWVGELKPAATKYPALTTEAFCINLRRLVLVIGSFRHWRFMNGRKLGSAV